MKGRLRIEIKGNEGRKGVSAVIIEYSIEWGEQNRRAEQS